MGVLKMKPETVLMAWVLLAVFFALGGALVGRTNDREIAGAALGLFLGPFGIVATAALEPSRRLVAIRHQDLAEAIVEALRAADPTGAADEEVFEEVVEEEPRSTVDETSDEDEEYELEELPVLPEGLEDDAYSGMNEGFYVDPIDPTRERYWDGEVWDTETYPREKRTPYPHTPQAP